jgi:hypothetical protein
MPASASPLQDAINRLTEREPVWKQFQPKPPVGAKPGARSTGRPSSSSAGSGGAGFDEADAALREYYAPRTLTSSDGIFTISWQPIKSILLEGDVRATFKDPPA